MGNKRALRTVALVLATSSVSPLSAASDILYEAWVDAEVSSLVLQDNGEAQGYVVTHGDTYDRAEYCALESEYFCVVSGIYAFAVPKKFDMGIRSWSARAIKFEVIQTGLTMSILGTVVSGISVIKTPASATAFGRQSSSSSYSLYSPERGLIGIRLPGNNVFLLAGTKGFACVVEASTNLQ